MGDRDEVYRRGVADAMKKWAAAHPSVDTQGIDDDEWLALAEVAMQRVALFMVERALGQV